jgi:predicted nucleic acid-binding protein
MEQELTPVEYTDVVAETPPSEYVDTRSGYEVARNHRLQELISHQGEYVKTLRELTNFYMECKREQIIPRYENERLFFKIPELAQVHQEFYDDLKQAVENILENNLAVNDHASLTIGRACSKFACFNTKFKSFFFKA